MVGVGHAAFQPHQINVSQYKVLTYVEDHHLCVYVQYVCVFYVCVRVFLPTHGSLRTQTDLHKNFTINYKTQTHHLTPAVISHCVYIMSKIEPFENMGMCVHAGIKRREQRRKFMEDAKKTVAAFKTYVRTHASSWHCV